MIINYIMNKVVVAWNMLFLSQPHKPKRYADCAKPM